MASTCRFLGIYERQIDDAGQTVDCVCADYGINLDDLWMTVLDEMEERFGYGSWTHISNEIVYLMFKVLRSRLEDIGIESDFYINGELDTSFCIDGEQV